MRKQKVYAKISITKEVHERLKKDRDNFQKVIGGGKWSISDTLKEYFKIMGIIQKEEKQNVRKKKQK